MHLFASHIAIAHNLLGIHMALTEAQVSAILELYDGAIVARVVPEGAPEGYYDAQQLVSPPPSWPVPVGPSISANRPRSYGYAVAIIPSTIFGFFPSADAANVDAYARGFSVIAMSSYEDGAQVPEGTAIIAPGQPSPIITV